VFFSCAPSISHCPHNFSSRCSVYTTSIILRRQYDVLSADYQLDVYRSDNTTIITVLYSPSKSLIRHSRDIGRIKSYVNSKQYRHVSSRCRADVPRIRSPLYSRKCAREVRAWKTNGVADYCTYVVKTIRFRKRWTAAARVIIICRAAGSVLSARQQCRRRVPARCTFDRGNRGRGGRWPIVLTRSCCATVPSRIIVRRPMRFIVIVSPAFCVKRPRETVNRCSRTTRGKVCLHILYRFTRWYDRFRRSFGLSCHFGHILAPTNQYATTESNAMFIKNPISNQHSMRRRFWPRFAMHFIISFYDFFRFFRPWRIRNVYFTLVRFLLDCVYICIYNTLHVSLSTLLLPLERFLFQRKTHGARSNSCF